MVDWDKPIVTRDGQPARFLGKLDDDRGTYVVAIDSEGEYLSECDSEGRVRFCDQIDDDDIFNDTVLHNVTLWIGLGEAEHCRKLAASPSREGVLNLLRDENATAICIRRVEMTLTEGEGL